MGRLPEELVPIPYSIPHGLNWPAYRDVWNAMIFVYNAWVAIQ